jgi:hypothetical protein
MNTCTLCLKDFPTKSKLERHLNNKKKCIVSNNTINNNKFKCEICNISFKFKSEYERHIQSKRHIIIEKKYIIDNSIYIDNSNNNITNIENQNINNLYFVKFSVYKLFFYDRTYLAFQDILGP